MNMCTMYVMRFLAYMLVNYKMPGYTHLFAVFKVVPIHFNVCHNAMEIAKLKTLREQVIAREEERATGRQSEREEDRERVRDKG